MSDDWDFYFCRVDDEPASIFVDLGLARDAPLDDRPHMAYVRVYMRSPRSDGLSSQEEFDALVRLENSLTSALSADHRTTYVGRNTCGGCRDFYFYTDDPNDWTPRVSKALGDFSQYDYEAGSHLDSEWKTYFDFLYPSPDDMQRFQNRRVCETLEQKGDSLSEPREIDHWAYFPDEAGRANFLRVVGSQGFTVRELSLSEDRENPFGVRFFRVDVPSFENIDDVTLPLHRAAIASGGDYDGWETRVVR
ncbi:MAG TPA: DUF695 domain-containing protein [Rhodothermales bacterium]